MNKKAFTLLELLVVVLIIGILAGIALPQYKRVVEKSKATHALSILKSVSKSIERYYLINNSYPTSFDDLDIEIPFQGTQNFLNENNTFAISNEDWSLTFENRGEYIGVLMGRIKGKYKGAYFSSYFSTPGNNSRPGVILCVERISNAIYIFDSNLPAGSYCEKIMGGIMPSYEDEYFRSYRLKM